MSHPPSNPSASATERELASDEELMAGVAQCDRQAFEQLYDRYAPLLNTLCVRILGRPSDASPVLVDIFWEVWRTAEKFDPNRGTARTYLLTLTRSRAIDALRARRREEERRHASYAARKGEADERQRQSEPAWQAMRREQSAALHDALDQLTTAQRQMLELAYFEGLSHSEIATRTDTPLGSVKTHIRQGLVKLRQTFRQTSAREPLP
jgi:RNA polymerase sigma-70 factor (ECF subfamily)